MEVKLTGIPETLLITVRARAEETLRKDAIVSDIFAIEMLEKMNIDILSGNKIAPSSQVGTVIRTQIFDRIVADFASRHPEGVIISLGCGLDARYKRLAPSCFCWYDLDVSESIHVRKHFFQETENYKMISRSMLDYEWMKEIPTDKPALIISEGVFMYFTEENLKGMVNEILNRFSNVEIAFDSIPAFLANRANLHSEVKKYNAQFLWGNNKTEDIKKWDDRIEIVNTDYYMNYHVKRWPFAMQLVRIVPKFRKGNKVIHIRKNNKN